MYSASTHNKGKSERFIRTLYDIVNEYINTYHKKIKMNPVDVKDNTVIDFIKEVDDKGLKFNVGDHVRIPKYIFPRGCTPNWSEEVFVSKN